MRKTLPAKQAATQLSNTVEAIDKNLAAGKMKVPASGGSKIHPLFTLPADFDPEAGLDRQAQAELIVRWLEIQGITLVFDDSQFRKSADQGVTRLETLMPPSG